MKTCRNLFFLAFVALNLNLVVRPVFAYDPPEFFGTYIIENETLVELTPTSIELKSFQVGEQVVPAFTNMPSQVKVIQTLHPKLIVYDQTMSTGSVHLSRLAPIPLGETPAEGYAYAPMGDVSVRIKPLEGDGMFLFQPQEALPSGYYAIYGGAVLGMSGALSGTVSLLRIEHPRQTEIYMLVEQFVDSIKMTDEDTAASLSYALSGTQPVPNSSSSASKFRKPVAYTGGGDVIPAGLAEKTDESGTFYKISIIVKGTLFMVSTGLGNLVGASGPKCMYVREVDGKFMVFTKNKDWMFTDTGD